MHFFFCLFVCFVFWVFLFCFLIGGDACRNTAAAANARARFRGEKKKKEEKKVLFLVEYNETFPEKEEEKNGGKKSRKNVKNINIFFS